MLKNLKSWFVVEEAGKPQADRTAKPASKPAPKAQAAPPTKAAAPTGSSATERPGVVTDKFSKVLLEAMEKANQPGFDYLEFKKALQNLKKMNMDEATRYQSAYVMAQSMNVLPQQLIDSAQYYLQELAKEERKFNTALQGQRQTQIADKKQQLTGLDQEIKDLEGQIKALEKKIATAKKQKEKTTSAIQQSSSKLQNTQNDFVATYNTIVGQISADVENMKSFLK